jgi:hypothetical protein
MATFMEYLGKLVNVKTFTNTIVAPLAGIEPATNGLEVRYSSAELQRYCISNGIRIRVAAVKGQSPRPLDDGDMVEQVGLEPTITEL